MNAGAPLPRVGFLGVGWIGCRRLEALAISGEADISAIADPDDVCRSRAAAFAPGARRVDSLERLLELKPDGIVISTPSAAHVGLSVACLEAGIPVFCQKPLGRNAEEVRRVVDCARASDLLLGVDLSYRHIPGLRRARECIVAGDLGEVFAADLSFHNAYGPDKPWFYDPALSGGGCLLDLGIHLVDAAIWCLGAAPASVRGRVLASGRDFVSGAGVEDYASADILFENGASARLACSWRLHAGQDCVIEFHFYGTRGGIAVRNVAGSFSDFHAELFRGTSRSLLAAHDPDWQIGALGEWCRRLRASSRYDPAIEIQTDVAAVIDSIYASSPASLQPPSVAAT